MRKSLLERFSEKYRIDATSGCWEWTASKDAKGYGIINLGGYGPTERAHRVSYELFKGGIPIGEGFHGICVLHSCDNSSCVNPEHLTLGTVQQNNEDMVARGRHVGGNAFGPHRAENMLRGEKHHQAKLSESDVLEIRNLLLTGQSGASIGRRFSVSKATVSKIKHRIIWNHI